MNESAAREALRLLERAVRVADQIYVDALAHENTALKALLLHKASLERSVYAAQSELRRALVEEENQQSEVGGEQYGRAEQATTKVSRTLVGSVLRCAERAIDGDRSGSDRGRSDSAVGRARAGGKR